MSHRRLVHVSRSAWSVLEPALLPLAAAASLLLYDGSSRARGDSSTVLVDVLILGGGIAGTSLAYHLSQRETMNATETPIRVALLDAASLGSRATGLSAGTLWSAGHSRSRAAAHLFDVGCEVEAHSVEVYQQVQRAGFDCGLVQSGNLILARSEQERTYLVEEHARLHSLGYNALMLCNRQAVLQVEPALCGGNSVAALWTLESGYVEPMLACRSIAEAAAAGAHGAMVFEDEEAIHLARADVEDGHGRRVKVSTASGRTFLARQVVVAAGVGCAALLRPLGLRVPIYPVQGTMVMFPGAGQLDEGDETGVGAGDGNCGGGLKHTLYVAEGAMRWQELYQDDDQPTPDLPRYSTFDPIKQVTITRHCYGRPMLGGDAVFGGSRVPMWRVKGAGPEELQPSLADVQGVMEHVSEFFPRAVLDKKDVEVAGAGAWLGVMPFSLDMRPLVGSLRPLGEQFRGLWLAGGFGPEGMMQAPGATRFLAQRVIAVLKEEDEERSDGSRHTCNNSNGSSGEEDVTDDARVGDAVMTLYDPCRRGSGVSLLLPEKK